MLDAGWGEEVRRLIQGGLSLESNAFGILEKREPLRLGQYMVVRKHVAFWMDDRPATRRDLIVADGSKKADDCRFDTSNHFDQGGDSW
jgi:hypothetical protein